MFMRIFLMFFFFLIKMNSSLKCLLNDKRYKINNMNFNEKHTTLLSVLHLCVLYSFVLWLTSEFVLFIRRYQWSWLFSYVYINRAHPFVKRRALIFSLIYMNVGHIPTHKISNFNPLFCLILLLFILCNLLGIRDMQEKKTHFILNTAKA